MFNNVECSGDEQSLTTCDSEYITMEKVNYKDSPVAGVICQGGDPPGSEQGCTFGALRLAGGGGEGEGRVEYCVNGYWGTVCDQEWGQREAMVACRHAGYPSAGEVAHARMRYYISQVTIYDLGI